MPIDNIEFFGAADRKGKTKGGKITSEYPAWYFDQHISELQIEIDRGEHGLKMGLIPQDKMYETKEEMKKLKERMTLIIKSKPKLTGKDTNILNGIYENLSDEIGGSMFSRTEMQKGLVNAHEEARRMTDPIIPIGDSGGVLENMNINPVDGKLSRNQASKAIKLIGKLLDRPTNIEYFRKDNNFGTYKSERSLEEMARD